MKRLAFSCGDPAGIGVEVLLKALLDIPKPWPFIPVLFGSRCLFEQDYVRVLLDIHDVCEWQEDESEADVVYLSYVYDLKSVSVATETSEQGRAQVAYIKAAAQSVLDGQCDALVTAPINKKSLSLAQEPFTDHTRLLKAFCNVTHVSMAFYSSVLSVVLATVHCPLMTVKEKLEDPQLLQRTILHAIEFSKRFCSDKPKIAVAGLNPHAGESGLFGTEETALIRPVMDGFTDEAVVLSGPFPPDTVFRQAVKGDVDCVIAMYHDQGLIPVKLLAFDEAVNVTLGLPFIRTSPDHGTAFELAGTQRANPKSLINALKTAHELSTGRT